MVEIIPKPAIKTSLLESILLTLAVLLLISLAFSFVYLKYAYSKTQDELENAKTALIEGETPEEIRLKERVLDAKKKIDDFATVFELHRAANNFFEFVEKSTHPKVYWEKVDLSPLDSQVSLLGRAENFKVLGQQMIILEEKEEIREIILSKISLGEGVQFSLELSFDPQLFK